MANLDVELDMRGLERLIAESPQKAERWLAGFAEDMVTDIKTSMNTSPPGRMYRRGRGGRTHVASQPGHPPNVDMASLINSVHQVPAGRLTRRIEDGVKHGIWMEEGTLHLGGGVAPRPFMDPAFQRARERIGEDARRKLGLEDV